VQARRARVEKDRGGIALRDLGIDEEHAVAAGGRDGRGGERTTLPPRVDALDDFRNPAEVGRVLVDAIDRARAQRAQRELVLALAADHDHGRGIAARGELTEHLQPVEVGHHQIEQQHIVAAALHRFEAAPAGVDDFERHAGAGPAKIKPHHIGDLRVILGVKDANHIRVKLDGLLFGATRRNVEGV